MKRKFKIIAFPLIFTLILISIVLYINIKPILPIGRANPDDHNNSIGNTSEKYCSYGAQCYEYSPLTFQKYSQIIEGNEPFTVISVKYGFDANQGDSNPEGNKSLILSGGLYFRSKYFNEITEIEGHLMKVEQGTHIHHYDKIFSVSDLDVILSYLETNHEYFFNGSEYEGLDIPYVTYFPSFKNEKYQFTFAIFDPIFVDSSYTSEHLPAWAISKCMDEPDPILQGLIDILETNFISQFE